MDEWIDRFVVSTMAENLGDTVTQTNRQMNKKQTVDRILQSTFTVSSKGPTHPLEGGKGNNKPTGSPTSASNHALTKMDNV